MFFFFKIKIKIKSTESNNVLVVVTTLTIVVCPAASPLEGPLPSPEEVQSHERSGVSTVH